MPIKDLDHVNLRTAHLNRLNAFYVDALEFESVETQGVKRGCWLGVGGKVMLHLIESERTDRTAHPQIEHFAFRAQGMRAVMERLDRMTLAYNLNAIPALGLVQLNLRDPDDNRLHLDFPIAEFVPGMAPARASNR